MKNYSVYIAPAIISPTETAKNKSGIGRKIVNKTFPNGAKHWERIGTIAAKNKKLALEWLKKNQAIESGFMFVLIQPKIKI
jgi:hypothetical protein